MTKKVNGKLNGLDDRRFYLQRAKAALAAMQGIAIGVEQGGTGVVLRRGSNSDAVGELQQLLRKKGFGLAIDNDFGAATELAVKQFQASAKLTADGIVGAETWAKLRK